VAGDVPSGAAEDPGVVRPRPKSLDDNYDKFKRSKRHEARLADRLGGRRMPVSGALAWSSSDPTTLGADVDSPFLTIEHKRAEPKTKSIGVKRDWLRQVCAAANRYMKTPAMILTFEGEKVMEQDWVLLPLPFVERMLKTLEDEDDG
jgi:hypothetical protein